MGSILLRKAEAVISSCGTGSAAPEAEIVFFVCVLSADLKKLTTIFLNDLLLCILCVTFLWLPFVFLIIKVKCFQTNSNLLNLFSGTGTGTEYKNVIIQGRNRSRNMQRKKGNRCNNLIIWASQHWLKLLIR